jgi:hypothetical protein
MVETLLALWMVWKFEVIAGAIILAIPFVRHRFRQNVLIAEFLNQAATQIAESLEDPAEITSGAKTKTKRSSAKAKKRKVRARLAKAARKANRSKKGEK